MDAKTIFFVLIACFILLYLLIKGYRKYQKRRQEKKFYVAIIKQRNELNQTSESIHDLFIKLEMLGQQFWIYQKINDHKIETDHLMKQALYCYELEQLQEIHLKLVAQKTILENCLDHPAQNFSVKRFDPLSNEPLLFDDSVHIVLNHPNQGEITLLINRSTATLLSQNGIESFETAVPQDSDYNHLGFISGAGYRGPFDNIFALADCESIFKLLFNPNKRFINGITISEIRF